MSKSTQSPFISQTQERSDLSVGLPTHAEISFPLGGLPDEEGVELASVAAAKCEAVKLAGKLICDRATEFWDTARLLMTVTDDRGLSLFTLDFVGMESPSLQTPRPKITC